ncbi:MAG TPA: ATP-dependent metallopeptidase FtsH/Yme1/Tma family protein [Gemmatimonadales bacterium]|nr:ATP-dependent metallopeptidase FtsH/Yme1/Tma family protein [Gemmatimonadales bacterium]
MQARKQSRTFWRAILTQPSLWAGILITLLLVGLGLGIRTLRAPLAPAELTYSALLSALDARQVASLEIDPGRELRGRMRPGAGTPGARETGFRVVYTSPTLDEVLHRAEAMGVTVAFTEREQHDRMAALNLLVVLAGFAVLGILLKRGLATQGGHGSLGEESPSSTTFANVAGNEGTVAELKEVVEFLRDPEKFGRIGARAPKGVLMFGPPGTGKTLMARAVAGEAGVPFFAISGSEVTGFLVGLGVARVKNLFRRARKRGGVIFIDEIDAIGSRRGANRSHNEDDRTLNQLLVEMDGFSQREGVLVIGATNRPEDLDPALRRPGRFDRSVSVGLPSADEREAILRLHVLERAVPVGQDVDLGRLARLMPQSSGADLANLVNEAAIVAARQGAVAVAWGHIESARDRLLLGKERTGFRASDGEWQIVAVHEAGHALAGVLCCPEDGLHKVTIQPRGQAMGVAFFSPADDLHLHSRRYLESQILKGLAGRAAEEIVFGPALVTSGARSDLQQTTRIAKEMVYSLGMGQSTGLVAYDPALPLSTETHATMDRDVKEIIEGLYARVRQLIETHRAALEALARALLERETIGGEEAVAILAANGAEPATYAS